MFISGQRTPAQQVLLSRLLLQKQTLLHTLSFSGLFLFSPHLKQTAAAPQPSPPGRKADLTRAELVGGGRAQTSAEHRKDKVPHARGDTSERCHLLALRPPGTALALRTPSGRESRQRWESCPALGAAGNRHGWNRRGTARSNGTLLLPAFRTEALVRWRSAPAGGSAARHGTSLRLGAQPPTLSGRFQCAAVCHPPTSLVPGCL